MAGEVRVQPLGVRIAAARFSMLPLSTPPSPSQVVKEASLKQNQSLGGLVCEAVLVLVGLFEGSHLVQGVHLTR